MSLASVTNNCYGPLAGPICVTHSREPSVKYGLSTDESGLIRDKTGSSKEPSRTPTARSRGIEVEEKPVAEHIREAYRLPVPEFAGQDPDAGEWRSPLWDFVRHVRGHSSLWCLNGALGFAAVERALGPVSEWAGHFGEAYEGNPDSLQEDFVEQWERVRMRPGLGLIGTAMTMTMEKTLPLNADKFRSKGYADFVTFAGWLQVARGNEPIALPVEKLSRTLFGSDQKMMNISRYIKWAVQDGFLKRVGFGSKRTGKADTYFFDVSKFDALRERAAPGIAASFAAAEHRERRATRRRASQEG